MGHVRMTQHIEAPIDHVWDLGASCERLPEWNVSIVEVKDCPGRLEQVGAGGAKATVDGTYAEARGGTDATVELEYELPMGMFAGVAEKLLGGSIERDLRHSMENFKALCESTIPAHV